MEDKCTRPRVAWVTKEDRSLPYPFMKSIFSFSIGSLETARKTKRDFTKSHASIVHREKTKGRCVVQTYFAKFGRRQRSLQGGRGETYKNEIQCTCLKAKRHCNAFHTKEARPSNPSTGTPVNEERDPQGKGGKR